MKLEDVENDRKFLEEQLNILITKIGKINISNPTQMPFGWRKAAKGRTVWRIIEEIISQNLEKYKNELGFDYVKPAESEVGVYDFEFSHNHTKSFVNIKSSVVGAKPNKDDISKAEGIREFYTKDINQNLYIATFVIAFYEDMTISIIKAIVFPVPWIPDIYINPSNNGNLQSKYYKNLDLAIKRTNEEFLIEFNKEYKIAIEKKHKRKS